MRRALPSSVAAIALAFGVTAATAQNTPEPRRGDDQSQRTQTDQMQRNQSSQTTGQSQNTPAEQRSDQSNQQGGQNQQGAQAPQQTGPAQGGAQGQSQQGTRVPAPGQNQQGAQAPQPGQSHQGDQAPRQGNQDSQAAARESKQPDPSGRIELGEQQQTRVSSAIRQQKIEPVTNLNFTVSVGTAVPSAVRLKPLPREVADVLPQYRSYSFFVAQREVVIVDPQSYRIVAFVPLSGGGTVGTASSRETKESSRDTTESAAPASPPRTRATRTERKRTTATEEKPRLTDHERQYRSVHTEPDETVGSSRPESVEIEEVPPRARRMVPRGRRPEDRGPERPMFPFFPLFDIFR
jgi:hypothetical protein